MHLSFIYTGVTDELGHPVPEPEANLNIVPPVAAACDEDVRSLMTDVYL